MVLNNAEAQVLQEIKKRANPENGMCGVNHTHFNGLSNTDLTMIIQGLAMQGYIISHGSEVTRGNHYVQITYLGKEYKE